MRVEMLKQEQLATLKHQMGMMGGAEAIGVERASPNEADLDPEEQERLKKEREVFKYYICLYVIGVFSLY
jgi:hypothetical protein